MQSGAIASRFIAVSSSVSPLLTLDEETLILTALSRMPTISAAVRSRIPNRSLLLNGFSIHDMRAGCPRSDKKSKAVNLAWKLKSMSEPQQAEPAEGRTFQNRKNNLRRLRR